MKASIQLFAQTALSKHTNALESLASTIESQTNISVQRLYGTPRKFEKIDPVTGITLVLSGLGTLISILAYWRSVHPTYTVTIQRGDITLTLENISEEQAIHLLSQPIHTNKPENLDEDMLILISEKSVNSTE